MTPLFSNTFTDTTPSSHTLINYGAGGMFGIDALAIYVAAVQSNGAGNAVAQLQLTASILGQFWQGTVFHNFAAAGINLGFESNLPQWFCAFDKPIMFPKGDQITITSTSMFDIGAIIYSVNLWGTRLA